MIKTRKGKSKREKGHPHMGRGARVGEGKGKKGGPKRMGRGKPPACRRRRKKKRIAGNIL